MRLPAINIPTTVDPALRQTLEAIKERLEVRDGARGSPYERAVTVRDLSDVMDVVVKGDRLHKPNQGTAVTPTAVRREVASTTDSGLSRKALDGEVARIMAEVARVERMAYSIQRTATESGSQLSQILALTKQYQYTRDDLKTDLETGAAQIIAAAASGTAVMDIGPDGSYVLFRHRNANLAGLGAGYTGAVRTGLGITAAGLIAGYNRKSDGAWQNSIVIDSATGDVTILGTLKANSVIEVGATVLGTTMGDIRLGSLNGTSALTGLANKLNKSAADILSGVISVTTGGGFVAGSLTWDGSGNRLTGSGVAMTPQGILGHDGSKVTFSINATTGEAKFGGSLEAASGSFAGNISTNGYVKADGQITAADGVASIVGNESGTAAHGVMGYGKSTTGNGVYGLSNTTGIGSGVRGLGRGAGNAGVQGAHLSGGTAVEGVAVGAGSFGVRGSGSAAGVWCDGAFRWGGLTASAPPGTSTTFLRGDMTWASISVAWSNITGIPATFTPAAHTQDWTTITGKPSTYPPSVHSHLFQDIVAGGSNLACQFSNDNGATWNNILLRKV